MRPIIALDQTAEHEEKGEDIPNKYPEDQPLPISMNALFAKSNAVSDKRSGTFTQISQKKGYHSTVS